MHLELENRGGRIQTRLDSDARAEKYVPSADRLFASAAKQYGAELLAIVLTGMGDDGREGACQVKRSGGRVIAESESTAVIYGMPRQAVLAGAVDEVLPLHEIPHAIVQGIGRDGADGSLGRGRG